jgi:phosphoadenosine phosphosulfate reductase
MGCKVCPLASSWWDGIANDVYQNEISDLLKKIEKYAKLSKPLPERKKFIEEGGWKARMGGRFLKNGGIRINETIDKDIITFNFLKKAQSWLKVCTLLGPIVEKFGNTYTQIINKQEFTFTISNRGKIISYYPYSLMNRFIISHLRGIANKVAYCVGCKACMVQCPVDAFVIDSKGKIFIREDKCIHCSNCIEFTKGKGCLVAKSLTNSGGGNMNLKGMDHYKHFGLRQNWLEHYFEYGVDCFNQNELGNLQYFALRVWLREANLLSASNKGDKSGLPTVLFEKLKPLGPFNPLVWAVIWSNLAYNSVIIKWFMLSVQPGEVYDKNDLIFMLGDDYSKATRDNAVTALLETFRHSPIGPTLKQGIPLQSGNNFRYSKEGWYPPVAELILYSLYLWAETTGRYTFSLNQLAESRGNPEAIGVDPVSIFGLNSSSFKGILQEIALHLDKYIRVTFVMDLDTVHLMPEIRSLDIIDLFR